MGIKRPYGGVAADDRRGRRRAALLDAALDCLGGDEADLSVRRVCAVTKLHPRYFYESFGTLDELRLALLTQITDEIVQRGSAAVAERGSTDIVETCRTAFEGAYSVFQDDPRKARAALVVSSGTDGLMEARRRIVMTYAEAMLGFLGQELDQPTDSASARAGVLYAVGGVLELTHAALTGDLVLSDSELSELAGGLLASTIERLTGVRPVASPGGS